MNKNFSVILRSLLLRLWILGALLGLGVGCQLMTGNTKNILPMLTAALPAGLVVLLAGLVRQLATIHLDGMREVEYKNARAGITDQQLSGEMILLRNYYARQEAESCPVSAYLQWRTDTHQVEEDGVLLILAILRDRGRIRVSSEGVIQVVE